MVTLFTIDILLHYLKFFRLNMLHTTPKSELAIPVGVKLANLAVKLRSLKWSVKLKPKMVFVQKYDLGIIILSK